MSHTVCVQCRNSIASRCDDDYTPLTCDGDGMPPEAPACGCAPELDLEDLERLWNQLDEAGNEENSNDDEDKGK